MDETIQVFREVEGRDFGASKLIRLVGGCDSVKLRCSLRATSSLLQVLLLSLYSAGSLAGDGPVRCMALLARRVAEMGCFV